MSGKIDNSFHNCSFQHSTFGHGHKTRKKVYFEEYEKDLGNKVGPGPAYYKPDSSVQSLYSKAPKYKFSQSSRWMTIKDNSSISPTRSINIKENKNNFSFSKTPRNFDPRRMNTLTCKMWKKGVTK